MTDQGLRGSPVRLLLCLSILCVLGTALGSAVGSTGFESWTMALHDEVAWQIVWDIRLPRSVGACAAGALLGLAGAMAQGLFRNPLADPYLLGSASGASLGVAVALALFGGNPFATELLVRIGLTGAAFVGAVLAVLLTLALARGVQHTLRLLLAGVIVGVVLGAVAGEMLFHGRAIGDTMRPAAGAAIGRVLGSLAKLPCAFIAWAALSYDAFT
jgi:iron complex transport system permease protein